MMQTRDQEVQDTLGNLGGGEEFSDEAFDEVFTTFDKDNSGTVEKNEMVVFIKQLNFYPWKPGWVQSRPALQEFQRGSKTGR